MAETIATTSTSSASPFVLRPFVRRFSVEVASWIADAAELRFVAPSCTPPVTPRMIEQWRKPGGHALLMCRGDDDPPIAYGELNPMRDDARELWIGHVVLKPAFRGRGLGERFTRLMLAHAFHQLRARRVTLVVFPENTRAIACYHRAGFRSVSEEFHEFGAGPKHRLVRMEARPGLPRRTRTDR